MWRWCWIGLWGSVVASAQTWFPVGGVEPFVHRIICPPWSPETVIVCADSMPPVAEVWRSNIQFFGGHGFRVSVDSARSFGPPRLTGFSVRDILILPDAPQIWLAAVVEYATGGVVLSTDAGHTWQWSENPRCPGYLMRLQHRAGTHPVFFAAAVNTNQGCRVSRDTFATCTGNLSFPVQSRDLSIVEDTVYLAADGYLAGGVWRSVDNGQTWQKDSIGLGNFRIWCVVPSRHQPNVLLCGADSLLSEIHSVGRGIYRSEDGGKTWRLVGAPGVRITAIAEHPLDPRYWVAAGDTLGVWVSGSYGTAWELHSDGLPTGVPVRTVALPAWGTREGVIALAGLAGGGLYRCHPIVTSVTSPRVLPSTLSARSRSSREVLIEYTLPEGSSVRWELIDVLGRIVAVRPVEWQGAGSHTLRWELPASLLPGWYAVRMFTIQSCSFSALWIPPSMR
ncbi:MAG: hypothetical protein NZ473_03500 [Candidatus Kapabacteria bacterium]|nr:hypothetical protein [Candidatus Kapabacteria bacterium]MDW8224970.1 hypothetical protein [Bacteroidota bacterium]